jgi:hypothetical protein
MDMLLRRPNEVGGYVMNMYFAVNSVLPHFYFCKNKNFDGITHIFTCFSL